MYILPAIGELSQCMLHYMLWLESFGINVQRLTPMLPSPCVAYDLRLGKQLYRPDGAESAPTHFDWEIFSSTSC